MAAYHLHEIIKNRRSPVIFSNKLIEQKKIDLLFEAARWAPSSMNEQPWRFVFSTSDNKEAFNKMFNCLLEGNKEWNANVPLLILTLAKSNFDYKNRANKYAMYDVASAVANLTFQANFMDLWVHQMGGFDSDKAKRDLNIPDGFDPVTMLAVGYLGNSKNVSENLIKRDQADRKRKPLKELVFRNTWNSR
jgi:nitroreductase